MTETPSPWVHIKSLGPYYTLAARLAVRPKSAGSDRLLDGEEFEPETVDAKATVMGKSNAYDAIEEIGSDVKVEVTQVQVRTHTLVVPKWLLGACPLFAVRRN